MIMMSSLLLVGLASCGCDKKPEAKKRSDCNRCVKKTCQKR